MRKERLILFLPLLGLVTLIIVLYSPQILSTHIPVLSELTFVDKTNVTLTFSIAVFAAIEGYSMFIRASIESKRFKLEDAKNELEKAYGPLYTLLNKAAAADSSENAFWLDFDERKKLDEIMATYPFMFTPQINDMWRDKIRTLGSKLETDNLKRTGYGINLGVYLEFRNLINVEYERKVKNYRALLETRTPSL